MILGLVLANVRVALIVLDGKTKNDLRRIVPIPEPVRPIAARLPGATTDVCLCNDFEAARVVANIPHVRFHDLRRSYASRIVQAGIDLRVVKEMLERTTIQATRRYAHLRTADLEAAVRKIASPRRHKA